MYMLVCVYSEGIVFMLVRLTHITQLVFRVLGGSYLRCGCQLNIFFILERMPPSSSSSFFFSCPSVLPCPAPDSELWPLLPPPRQKQVLHAPSKIRPMFASCFNMCLCIHLCAWRVFEMFESLLAVMWFVDEVKHLKCVCVERGQASSGRRRQGDVELYSIIPRYKQPTCGSSSDSVDSPLHVSLLLCITQQQGALSPG